MRVGERGRILLRFGGSVPRLTGVAPGMGKYGEIHSLFSASVISLTAGKGLRMLREFDSDGVSDTSPNPRARADSM